MSAAQKIAQGLDRNYRASGDGYACKCPIHDDQNASLSVSDGKEGRVLVYCHAGCDGKAVIGELKARNLWPEVSPERRPRSAGGHAVGANDNRKATAPKGPRSKTVATYNYFDHTTGELKMQVLRKEPKGFSQRRPDPDHPGQWIWGVSAEHRTLYKAQSAAQATGLVLIVEGEKDVDTLTALGFVATCNPCGAGKWQDGYSEILRGKDVLLLPDNDLRGREHADIVGRALQDIAASVRVLHLPNLPEKGDVSDWLAVDGNDGQKLADLCEGAPDWMSPDTATPEQVGQDTSLKVSANDEPFVALGYNRGKYFYMPKGQQQVVELSASAHNKGNLLGLAPLAYWSASYPGSKTATFDVDQAVDGMLRACEARGVFSPDLLRGRGAWWDDGRIVLHCGDRVYVDGTPNVPSAVNSRYVYQVGRPMRANIDRPLDLGGAMKFLDLVKMMPWVRPIEALYVAGWCALAHIGGVLNWRPHIWVVGAKGSGKSHVMSKVIQPILGEANVSNLFVAGESTEAGIRQDLGCDAIPVLFDEAEGEDQRSHERLQRILALVRQSSSETGAKMVKGSATGSAMSFQIRSCFAFSSINASLVQQSDRSRVAIVELMKERQVIPFEDILTAEAALFDGDFVARFHARAIAQAATIRENVRVFTSVVAGVMKEQRAGDQLGTLLAGAYSLTSDDVVSFEDAVKWVAAHNLDDERAEVEDMSDERKCLDRILESKLEIAIHDELRDKRETKTVIEWISQGNETPVMLALQREGIHVLSAGRHGRAQGIVILNGAEGIRKLLRGSPWEHADYNKVMRRLPGAESLKDPIFVAAIKSTKRGLRINLGIARA